MRTVTFVSKYDGLSIIQKEGREKRARLWCQAPGLDIYLIGSHSGAAFDRLNWMAMTMAQSMNIPLIALHYVKGSK